MTMQSTAIVLAGGRSSRMGQPKALLLFDDQPLIVHVVNLLRPMFADVVVVAAPGQELPAMPVTLVRDDVAYQGPVGGISYGLAASGGEVSFVSACDSAFLNPSLIEHLLSRLPDYDVVVPHWQGRLQPLHAVYRRTVLPYLQDQLARGDLRPVHLCDKVRTCEVGEEEIRAFDPEGWSFFNMNTPEEYAQAQERWHRLKGRNGTSRPTIDCTVELFGVARMISHTSELSLSLPDDATLRHVFAKLAAQLPVLAGRVISSDGTQLMEGYACNVNGRAFVRDAGTSIASGDSIVILAADAGG